MPIFSLIQRGTYDSRDVQMMVKAFDEALRLACVTDRTSRRAELIALRIIAQFEKGETDTKRVAQLAVTKNVR